MKRLDGKKTVYRIKNSYKIIDKLLRKICSKVAKPMYNSASYIVNRFRNLALRELCEAKKT